MFFTETCPSDGTNLTVVVSNIAVSIKRVSKKSGQKNRNNIIGMILTMKETN